MIQALATKQNPPPSHSDALDGPTDVAEDVQMDGSRISTDCWAGRPGTMPWVLQMKSTWGQKQNQEAFPPPPAPLPMVAPMAYGSSQARD